MLELKLLKDEKRKRKERRHLLGPPPNTYFFLLLDDDSFADVKLDDSTTHTLPQYLTMLYVTKTQEIYRNTDPLHWLFPKILLQVRRLQRIVG